MGQGKPVELGTVAMVYLECCACTPKADTSGHGATSWVIDGPTFDFGNDFADSFFDDGTFGSSDTLGSNTVDTDTARGRLRRWIRP